jgi:hypothetical protein
MGIQVALDPDYLNTVNKEGVLYLKAGTKLEAGGKPVTHEHSLNGVAFSAIEQADSFVDSGDDQQGKLDIIFAIQPQVGDTLRVKGKLVEKIYEFIANGGTPVGDQIALGTNVTNTNTAVRTQLDADKTTLGIVSATVVGTVITQLLGSTDGGALEAEGTTATADSILVTVLTVPISGIAVQTIEYRKTPTEDTGYSWAIQLVVNDEPRYVEFIRRVQASDTPTLMATGMAALIRKGIDAGAPTEGVEVILGLGPTDTAEHLKTALRLIFGNDSAAAVDNTDTVITLTALGSEAVGEEIDTIIDAFLKPPDVPEVDPATGDPQVTGLKKFTKVGNLTFQAQQSTVSIQTLSSVTPDLLASVTPFTTSFEFYNNNDIRTMVAGSGRSGLGYTSDFSKRVLMFNAASVKRFIQGKQFYLSIQDDEGNFKLLKLHKVQLVNFEYNPGPDKAGVFKVTVLVRSIPGRLDKQGWFYEPVAA